MIDDVDLENNSCWISPQITFASIIERMGMISLKTCCKRPVFLVLPTVYVQA